MTMNDLTREASKRAILEETLLKAAERLTVLAIKYCPKDHHDWEEVKRLSYFFVKDTVPNDTKLTRGPQKPLKGRFSDYLTGLECGCDTLVLTEHKNFDIEAYSDGYSEGVAAGMTIMERNKQQLPDKGE